ncbi:MAG: aminodeoxychorismate lyase [Sedimenticola sp.]
MLIDGKPADSISVLDRGLQYGDGLFETISVIQGTPCLWQGHMARLESGCQRLGIPTPDQEQLLTECRRVSEETDRCVVKIIITRGEGGQGYCPPQQPMPSRIVYRTTWPERPEQWQTEGVKIRLCTTKLASAPSFAGIKHLNRLPQVMARSEWDDPDIAEGLMLDEQENVIEGTMSNLFLVTKGALLTPSLDRCGVAGVMQDKVIEVASKLGLPVTSAEISLDTLRGAEALFLTNSVIGIWPVKEVSGQTYDISAIDRRLLSQVMEQGFSF